MPSHIELFRSYCTPTDQHAWPDKTTPLFQSAWSMTLSAITVDMSVSDLFIYGD